MNFLKNFIRNFFFLALSLAYFCYVNHLLAPYLLGEEGNEEVYVSNGDDNDYVRVAWTVDNVPNTRLEGNHIHVSNPDSIISQSFCDSINFVLSEVRDKADVFVVALHETDLEGNDFANELFNHWGIGDKDKHNGVLILMTEVPHFVRIEPGYGLEGLLTDALCGKILDDVAVPHFKNNRYSEGLYHTACAVADVLNGKDYEESIVTGFSSDGEFSSSEEDMSVSEILTTLVEICLVLAFAGWLFVMMGFYIYNFLLIFAATFFWSFTSDINESLSGTYKILNGKRMMSFKKMCLLPFALISYLPRLGLKYIYLRFNRFCPQCDRTSMEYLSDKNIKLLELTPIQVKEEELGSRVYRAWKCRYCNGVHTEFHKVPDSKCSICSKCGADLFKNISNEVTIKPTENTGGKMRVTNRCQYCGDEKVTFLDIRSFAAEREYNRTHASSGGGGRSGGSFGGGRSGGGGASRSW